MCIDPPRPREHPARGFPAELCHQRAGRHPLRDRDAVVAVGRHDVVIRAERRDGADGHRLLADVEMQEAADLSGGVGACRLLLEAPDEVHLPVQGGEVVRDR